MKNPRFCDILYLSKRWTDGGGGGGKIYFRLRRPAVERSAKTGGLGGVIRRVNGWQVRCEAVPGSQPGGIW